MNTLNVDGRSIGLDDDGYLRDLVEWNEAVASALAEQEGLALEADHWEIIHLLRALRAWPQIELIDDRAGNLFKAIVTRPQEQAA